MAAVSKENEDLEREIIEADKRARLGRLERLKLLRSVECYQEMPIPVLVAQYFEETKLCWYVGAYVATILMVQVTFEEWLRSYYRTERGGFVARRVRADTPNLNSYEVVAATGELDSGRPVEKAGFKDLLKQALVDDLISDTEFLDLEKVRETRNPYEHTRDERSPRGPSFFDQVAKIVVPEMVGSGVEDEARWAVVVLLDLLPKLCVRV